MANDTIKDREIRVEDIPQDAKQLLLQYLKPYPSYVIALGLAALMIYLNATRIYGIIFGILVLALMIFSKNRKLVLVTDKYIVGYNANEIDCKIAYFDEVNQWDLSSANSLNSVVLYLNDNSLMNIQVIYLGPVEKALKKVIPEKQIKHELKLTRRRPK